MKRDGRKTICVDFDGVINPDYAGAWKGAHVITGVLPDKHRTWLFDAVQRYQIVILTTRAATWRGRRAVRAWLKSQVDSLWYPSPASVGIEEVRVTNRKPPALIYIDDRAWRYNGQALPSLAVIERAKPWWRQPFASLGLTDPNELPAAVFAPDDWPRERLDAWHALHAALEPEECLLDRCPVHD